MTDITVDNPFFARMWIAMSSRERKFMTRLRQENLTGLTGRVLEIGAGTGTNFAFYPDTVTEVVAVEPEVRLAPLARKAALTAPVPVTVRTETVEDFDGDELFDAVVCSLVLCSVDQPESVLRQMYSRLKPGGELRYFEHVASEGCAAGRNASWIRRSGPRFRATVTRTGKPRRASSARDSRSRTPGGC